MKQALLFGALASVLSVNAYADPAIITTQDYVDTNFQTKIPAKSVPGHFTTVVTTTDTAGVTGEREIWASGYGFYGEGTHDYMQDYKDSLVTLEDVRSALQYITSYETSASQEDPNKPREIPVFTDGNRVKFWKIITTNSLDTLPWPSAPYNIIPSVVAVKSGLEAKQDKMTCARYIENAEETSENCLLWNLPD